MPPSQIIRTGLEGHKFHNPEARRERNISVLFVNIFNTFVIETK
jgi:hypothetical protein